MVKDDDNLSIVTNYFLALLVKLREKLKVMYVEKNYFFPNSKDNKMTPRPQLQQE